MRWVFALALLGIAWAAPARAAWNPPGWERRPAAPASRATEPLAWALGGAIRFYQQVLSPVDGPSCPSYPTCSAYGAEALRRYGALKGTLLTAARLLSDADEGAFAPRIQIHGTWKTYDPVESDAQRLFGAP